MLDKANIKGNKVGNTRGLVAVPAMVKVLGKRVKGNRKVGQQYLGCKFAIVLKVVVSAHAV